MVNYKKLKAQIEQKRLAEQEAQRRRIELDRQAIPPERLAETARVAEAAMAQKDQRLDEAETRATNAETRNAELERKNAELERKLAGLEAAGAESAARAQETMARLTEAEQRSARLEAEKTSAEKGKAEAEKRAAEAGTKVANARLRVNELLEERKELMQRLAGFQADGMEVVAIAAEPEPESMQEYIKPRYDPNARAIDLKEGIGEVVECFEGVGTFGIDIKELLNSTREKPIGVHEGRIRMNDRFKELLGFMNVEIGLNLWDKGALFSLMPKFLVDSLDQKESGKKGGFGTDFHVNEQLTAIIRIDDVEYVIQKGASKDGIVFQNTGAHLRIHKDYPDETRLAARNVVMQARNSLMQR